MVLKDESQKKKRNRLFWSQKFGNNSGGQTVRKESNENPTTIVQYCSQQIHQT
jgi:hypothetical protein